MNLLPRNINRYLEASGRSLLLYDPATGKYVPTPEADEKQRADRAEQEIERLRQELAQHSHRNGA